MTATVQSFDGYRRADDRVGEGSEVVSRHGPSI